MPIVTLTTDFGLQDGYAGILKGVIWSICPQAQIADMVVEHQAAQMLVYRAAWLKDQGKPNQYETSVAKLAASEAAVHAANECMKIYGSYGFSTEFPAERFYRDAKSLQVVEGTSNIQKVIISGMACGFTPNRE